jgi:hypothetical protein
MRPLALLVPVALVLLVTGCGGGKPAAGTTTSGSPSGAVAFARCMRAHGIPGWPDPTSAGVFDKRKLRALGVEPSRVRSIEERSCSGLLPSGGPQPSEHERETRLADARSFARCIRRHGIPRFPDPNAQGLLSVEMVQAQGIDVHSPAVLRVVQACLPAAHGALTIAKIREALSHAP